MKARQALYKYFEINEKGTSRDIHAMFPEFEYAQISYTVSNLFQRGELIPVGHRIGNKPQVFRLKRKMASEDLDIVEQCKCNWQGYQIHKIFGSGGRVSAL
ncbi:TPA: hypothetical protein OMT00_001637 [Klebsiella aerogenes]|nr:hypothetical protein [Klebsiella aerogenes]